MGIKKSIVDAFEKMYLEKYPDKNINEYQYYYILKMVEQAVHEGLAIYAGNELKSANVSKLNTPLLALMHDTRNDFDRFRSGTDQLNKDFKTMTEKPPSSSYVAIERIRESGKRVMNALDEYYITNKELGR